MVYLIKGVINHENGGNYLSKDGVSRVISGGINFDPYSFPTGEYVAPALTFTRSIPTILPLMAQLVRHIKQEQPEDIHYLWNMTGTDK